MPDSRSSKVAESPSFEEWQKLQPTLGPVKVAKHHVIHNFHEISSSNSLAKNFDTTFFRAIHPADVHL